jgi:hypothetical protein
VLSYGEVVRFMMNGEYVGRKKISFNSNKDDYANPTQFAKINENYFFWRGTTGVESFNEPVYTLLRMDTNFNITGKFLPTKRKLIEFYRFHEHNSILYIGPLLGSDTIYSVFNKDVAPGYYIDFGGKSFKPKDRANNGNSVLDENREMQFCSSVRNFIVTNDFVYFIYSCSDKDFQCIYSKNNGTVLNSPMKYGMFPLAVTGGIGDKLIGYIEATDLKEFVSKSKEGNEFPTYLKEHEKTIELVSDQDNPVILLIKLKAI